ncbi:hypothetical protein VT50_0233330 [Streptomyces antioxidans]|uniref:HTH cro/C1-type domain-containing protein n=2 Tax=Streptomyces TaxID=1883 RepID=A0A1V4CVH0_9ACTN|nr:hypothetical protein VT50_0233330 [Streptomyces antioxidans]
MPEILRQWMTRRGLRSGEQLADVFAVHPRHAARLVSGERKMTLSQVQALSKALRLNWAEAKLLHSRAGHLPPPPPPRGGVEIPHPLLRTMHRQQDAAMIEGPDWELLDCNDAALRNFPWFSNRGVNVMEGLLVGEGRAQLVDREEVWIPALVAQIKTMVLQSVHYQVEHRHSLMAMTEVIRRDPAVERFWLTSVDLQDHTYGRRRAMYLPGWGEEPVELDVLSFALEHPDVSTGTRMVVVAAADGRPQPPV